LNSEEFLTEPSSMAAPEEAVVNDDEVGPIPDEVEPEVPVEPNLISLEEIRGKFSSLEVLIEQLPYFDLTVVTQNPLRIWKHECEAMNDGWKPDAMQLNAGAKVKIQSVAKVTGYNGKGWNENSEYWMGSVGKQKWIRLINFRGMATTIPDLDMFKERVGAVVSKVQEMQELYETEQQRRSFAEDRCLAAENRVAEVEQGRIQAESNLNEMEQLLQSSQSIAEEKLSNYVQDVELAKREANDATVLMKYFERRMIESSAKVRENEQTTLQAEDTLRKIEQQMREMEQRESMLQKQLQDSERARADLEVLMGQLNDPKRLTGIEEADEEEQQSTGKKKRKSTRKSKRTKSKTTG